MRFLINAIRHTFKPTPSRDAAAEARCRADKVNELSKKPFTEIDKELGVSHGSGNPPTSGYLSPKYYTRQKTLSDSEKAQIIGE